MKKVDLVRWGVPLVILAAGVGYFGHFANNYEKHIINNPKYGQLERFKEIEKKLSILEKTSFKDMKAKGHLESLELFTNYDHLNEEYQKFSNDKEFNGFKNKSDRYIFYGFGGILSLATGGLFTTLNLVGLGLRKFKSNPKPL